MKDFLKKLWLYLCIQIKFFYFLFCLRKDWHIYLNSFHNVQRKKVIENLSVWQIHYKPSAFENNLLYLTIYRFPELIHLVLKKGKDFSSYNEPNQSLLDYFIFVCSWNPDLYKTVTIYEFINYGANIHIKNPCGQDPLLRALFFSSKMSNQCVIPEKLIFDLLSLPIPLNQVDYQGKGVDVYIEQSRYKNFIDAIVEKKRFFSIYTNFNDIKKTNATTRFL